jgi:hypothetical protein
MISVEVKTAHKTPDPAAIHEELIPFEEVDLFGLGPERSN